MRCGRRHASEGMRSIALTRGRRTSAKICASRRARGVPVCPTTARVPAAQRADPILGSWSVHSTAGETCLARRIRFRRAASSDSPYTPRFAAPRDVGRRMRRASRAELSSQHLLNALRCGLDGVSPKPHHYERRGDGEREKKDPRRKGEVSEERHGAQCTHPYGRDRGFHVVLLHAASVPTLCRFRCSRMHTAAGGLDVATSS